LRAGGSFEINWQRRSGKAEVSGWSLGGSGKKRKAKEKHNQDYRENAF
jgi:hypothetical protein